MKKRNAGLDLCRILSMLGIVILHVIGYGGAQQVVDGVYTTQYWTTEFLFICAMCSVDVFALMSGYLSINKKNGSFYRTLELISIVAAFCFVITIGFVILVPEVYMYKSIMIKGFFPILSGRYWYITHFVPIMILQPFLNKMILSLTEKQHMKLCILLALIFTVAPAVAERDLFNFAQGYSFAWLLCLYVIGAYLKRSKIDSYNLKKRYLALAFVVMAIALLLINMFSAGGNRRLLMNYDSPIILLMGLCFFLFFKNSNITKGTGLMKLLSMVAFDVYIIHSHIFIFDNVLAGSFAKISTLPAYLTIPMVLLCSTAIYIACAIVGLIRTKMFELVRINKLLMICSAKIDKLIYFVNTEAN